jgi:hypothetical protein
LLQITHLGQSRIAQPLALGEGRVRLNHNAVRAAVLHDGPLLQKWVQLNLIDGGRGPAGAAQALKVLWRSAARVRLHCHVAL